MVRQKWYGYMHSQTQERDKELIPMMTTDLFLCKSFSIYTCVPNISIESVFISFHSQIVLIQRINYVSIITNTGQ